MCVVCVQCWCSTCVGLSPTPSFTFQHSSANSLGFSRRLKSCLTAACVFKLYPYSAPPPVPQAAPVDSEHYNVEERHSGREIRYQQPCVFDAEQVAFLSGDSESSQQMLSERMKACVDVICDIRATTDTIQTTALAPHSRWDFLYAEGWEAFIMTRATSADWRSCQH